MSKAAHTKTPKEKHAGSRAAAALLKTLGAIVLFVIIAVSLALVIPRLFGFSTFCVVSGSMEPRIPMGSLIVVRPAEPEEIDEGEIIAFTSYGNAIVHRVVENRREERSFKTKGDANNTEDINAVPYDEVLGTLAFHIPQVGRALMLYSSLYGKLMLAGAALLGLSLTVSADMIGAPKDEAEEERRS